LYQRFAVKEMTLMEKNSNAISPNVAILAVVLTFVLLQFLGTIFFILFDRAFALVAGELLLIVVPLSYMLYKRVNVREYIKLEMRPKAILLGVSLGILLFLVDLVVSTTLVSILGTSAIIEESNRLLLEISSSRQGLLLLIVALSLAGVCEEFTFRGFLQTAINSRYSFGVALLVSSAAFGFFHFDPQAVYTVSAFLLGLLLGYIYHHWHSYVITAVAHATLNLVVLTIIVLFM